MVAEPLSQFKTVFYCIGSTKCGTTWLRSALKAHPEVHIQPEGEVRYWDQIRAPFLTYQGVARRLVQLDFPSVSLTARLIGRFHTQTREKLERYDRYRTMYREGRYYNHSPYAAFLAWRSVKSSVVADVTPNYTLLSSRTYEEMNNLHSNCRFLLLMRDPVPRLWSSIRHGTRSVQLPDEELTALQLRRFEDAIRDPFHPENRKSRYDTIIERLEEAVPREQILYMFYEAIFDEKSIHPLSAFLNITPFDADFNTIANLGSGSNQIPDAGLFERALDIFGPTYEFVRTRFGGSVPRAWAR